MPELSRTEKGSRVNELPNMAVVRLDWLSGLVPAAKGTQLAMQVRFSSGVADVGVNFQNPTTAFFARTATCAFEARRVVESLPLRQLFRLRLGDWYTIDRRRRNPLTPLEVSTTELQFCSAHAVLDRATSRYMTGGEAATSRYWPADGPFRRCPSQLKLLAIEDPAVRVRILVPGSEMVRAFYAPSMPFLEHLYRGAFVEASWLHLHPEVTFDGFKFAPVSAFKELPTLTDDALRTSMKSLTRVFNTAIRNSRNDGEVCAFEAYPPVLGRTYLAGYGTTFTSEDGFETMLLLSRVIAEYRTEAIQQSAAIHGTPRPLHGLKPLQETISTIGS
jgi:hypothetical protein